MKQPRSSKRLFKSQIVRLPPFGNTCLNQSIDLEETLFGRELYLKLFRGRRAQSFRFLL